MVVCVCNSDHRVKMKVKFIKACQAPSARIDKTEKVKTVSVRGHPVRNEITNNGQLAYLAHHSNHVSQPFVKTEHNLDLTQSRKYVTTSKDRAHNIVAIDLR